jgi:hypothetical protein
MKCISGKGLLHDVLRPNQCRPMVKIGRRAESRPLHFCLSEPLARSLMVPFFGSRAQKGLPYFTSLIKAGNTSKLDISSLAQDIHTYSFCLFSVLRDYLSSFSKRQSGTATLKRKCSDLGFGCSDVRMFGCSDCSRSRLLGCQPMLHEHKRFQHAPNRCPHHVRPDIPGHGERFWRLCSISKGTSVPHQHNVFVCYSYHHGHCHLRHHCTHLFVRTDIFSRQGWMNYSETHWYSPLAQ